MFAHSIKNPDTIHYFRRRQSGFSANGTPYRWTAYLCISASSTTPSKRTRDVSKVTCKNCVRELSKRGML